MVSKEYDVIWDNVAILELQEVYEDIKKKSETNAINTLDEILRTVTDLRYEPMKYEADRFRSNNDGTYRAFEKNSHRVMYRIRETDILITGVRHARMNPITHYKNS